MHIKLKKSKIIEKDLTQLYKDINNIKPPKEYENLNETFKKACSYYIQGLRDYLLYKDNDINFVSGDSYFDKGSELMHKALNEIKDFS